MINELGRGAIHPFPARMAPSIAFDALSNSMSRLRVLDPMSGSGTVPAVAQANGHIGCGIDCDPLAVLNAKVWTTPLDVEQFLEKSQQVLVRAKTRYSRRNSGDLARSLDPETIAFIEFWFDKESQKQLLAISTSISGVRSLNVRDALWSSFSRMIIAKKYGVSLAMDLSHSRPHRSFAEAPVLPFDVFLPSAVVVAKNVLHRHSRGNGPPTKLRLGDAKNLPFRRESFDLVVTSPPYLNAIDYLRCSKFSLVWMGYSIPTLRTIRRNSIGAEFAASSRLPTIAPQIAGEYVATEKLSKRKLGLLHRYVFEMAQSISEVARILKKDGRAVYVVGNNNIDGVFIRNSEFVKCIARDAGLRLVDECERELPPNRRYLPPPSSESAGKNFQSRMRAEVVLSFEKGR